MAFPGTAGLSGGGRERFPPLLARERARRGSGDAPHASHLDAVPVPHSSRDGDASSSDSDAPAPGGRDAPAEPWGAAALPVLRRDDGAAAPPPPPAPPSSAASTLLSQLQVPVGIGIPGSTATIPASITSPAHLAAYAEYCKRALSNAVNGPLLSKRDALAHQARALRLSRVQARADEVRAIAREAERGVRTAADECCDALAAVEGRRLLALQAQADELRRALAAVQRCAESAAAACAADEAPLAFLERFARLSDTAERITAKPVREDLEVCAEAFEREARAAAAGPPDRDAEVLHKLLTVKDEMIWSLLEERDALRAAAAATQAEVAQLRAALGELRRGGPGGGGDA